MNTIKIKQPAIFLSKTIAKLEITPLFTSQKGPRLKLPQIIGATTSNK